MAGVPVLASLIRSTSLLPPVPSQPWLLRTGLCHDDVHRSAASEISSGVSPKYLAFEAGALEDVVQVWTGLGSTRATHAGDVTDDLDEDDFRGWLQELVLTAAEQDNMFELAREAPTRVQLHRVLSIFARMSAAHRIEMRTGSLRCAGPLRNKQRVQDKKILRRELESFRREQVALRQEWEAAAAARRKAVSSERAASQILERAAALAAATTHEHALCVLAKRELVENEKPSALSRRRWYFARDLILQTCALPTLMPPDEPQKLQDAIIAAIRLASSAFASAFATAAACPTEPAPSAPSTPTSHELTEATGVDEFVPANAPADLVLEAASLCSIGAEACAVAGKRLLARRATSAALPGNGVEHWRAAAALWQRQHVLLKRVLGDSDSKVTKCAQNIASARANISSASQGC